MFWNSIEHLQSTADLWKSNHFTNQDKIVKNTSNWNCTWQSSLKAQYQEHQNHTKHQATAQKTRDHPMIFRGFLAGSIEENHGYPYMSSTMSMKPSIILHGRKLTQSQRSGGKRGDTAKLSLPATKRKASAGGVAWTRKRRNKKQAQRQQ